MDPSQADPYDKQFRYDKLSDLDKQVMFHYENPDDMSQIIFRSKTELKEGMMTYQYRERRDWNVQKEPSVVLPGPYNNGQTKTERQEDEFALLKKF